MASSRRQFNRDSFDKKLDKKVDQFFQAGMQFVDGVSGKRPGSRNNKNSTHFSRASIKNVGNWVNKKMETFFDEDEDDWGEDFNIEEYGSKSYQRDDRALVEYPNKYKKPLQAISLRETNNEQKKLIPQDLNSEGDWEDSSYYQINKWQRPNQSEVNESDEIISDNRKNTRSRKLPRSRRRKT